MILLDTSGLFAALDRDQSDHVAAAKALAAVAPPRLLSPFVLAELDYLISTRMDADSAALLLAQVAAGAYRLEPFSRKDVARALDVLAAYADLDLGLADASILVLAERHGVHDVLTLDQRHFRAVTGPGGRALRILPADL